MYVLKCKSLKLESAVTFKRFYNPPTKKSWSKQNPLFRTPRPLVDPYNLGRLHPEKEWWKLPKKGLKPETFMGFPDVKDIEKHGGSLYTHSMDGSTLTMVVYRCIDKKIRDVDIWNQLTLQALKLAVSLDPYIVSVLFLYFSISGHYDYKFVSTFVGRILATLDQFTLEECSNVILAMNNPQFCHKRTFEYVIKHSENLSLTGNLKVEECLRFLTCLKNVETPPQNCISAIAELIEMSDLEVVDNTLIFEALDSCCKLKGKIDELCVTKLFNECSQVLESIKKCNHHFNLVFINALVTYSFKNDHLLHSTINKTKEKIFYSTFEEKCRYVYLLPKLANKSVEDGVTSSENSIRDSMMKLADTLKKEVMKDFGELVKNDTLSLQVAVGTLNGDGAMDQYELKLLEGLTGKLKDLGKDQVLELYNGLSKTSVPLDGLEYIKKSVVSEAWNLENLNLSQMSSLVDCKDPDFIKDVPGERVERCFHLLLEQLERLNSTEILALIKFCSQRRRLAEKLLVRLRENRRCLYHPKAIVEIINLYKECKYEVDEFVFELLDGLCRRRGEVLSEDRARLIETLRDNQIKYDSLRE